MEREEFPPETLPLPRIKSDARYVIYSQMKGLISEHSNPGDAAVAFYHYAPKESKAPGRRLPGIYKRTDAGWVKA
jgi:hypothetical protein